MIIFLEALEAEEWPDGTFGGARLVPGQPSEPIRIPRPDPHAAEHVAELVAALHRRRTPPRRKTAA
ncbi:hypothetical protein [Streptomyces scopuliridis]|uniref:hypothetical protein n=1 Tax=Streptomyces scopuliridis TaxID=452529 RepID=UPI003691B1E1